MSSALFGKATRAILLPDALIGLELDGHLPDGTDAMQEGPSDPPFDSAVLDVWDATHNPAWRKEWHRKSQLAEDHRRLRAQQLTRNPVRVSSLAARAIALRRRLS